MNISAWSIRNPVPSLLLFMVLTFLGVQGFNSLLIQQFPDIELPVVTVTATMEGASPSQLETEVARKIEDELTGLTELDSVTTTITDGSVSINVAFNIGKDSQVALDEVKSAVDQVLSELPSGMENPTVTKSELNESPLSTYVVSSERLDEAELSWLIDNDIEQALMCLPIRGAEAGRDG